MADEYRFLTAWLLAADPADVWEAIYHPEHWPEWWPGVETVEKLADGDADGVGSVYSIVWRSRLPYAVRFDARTTRVQRPRLIEATATGELTGVGRWRFFAAEDALAVTYEWNVRTTGRWMNTVAPLARPAFGWNHGYVMRRGGEGLALRVGGRLIAQSS